MKKGLLNVNFIQFINKIYNKEVDFITAKSLSRFFVEINSLLDQKIKREYEIGSLDVSDDEKQKLIEELNEETFELVNKIPVDILRDLKVSIKDYFLIENFICEEKSDLVNE